MTRLPLMRHNLIAICLLLVLPGAAPAPDLWASTADDWKVMVFSELSPITINRIHSWRVRLLDANDEPVDGASMEFIGGMPDHDHGLPTQPQITASLGGGEYRLEGLRFHMPGRWQIDVRVQADGVEHSATLEFTL